MIQPGNGTRGVGKSSEGNNEKAPVILLPVTILGPRSGASGKELPLLPGNSGGLSGAKGLRDHLSTVASRLEASPTFHECTNFLTRLSIIYNFPIRWPTVLSQHHLDEIIARLLPLRLKVSIWHEESKQCPCKERSPTPTRGHLIHRTMAGNS